MKFVKSSFQILALEGAKIAPLCTYPFGHTFANSGNPDEMAPYEPSHQDFHCLLSLLLVYSND